MEKPDAPAAEHHELPNIRPTRKHMRNLNEWTLIDGRPYRNSDLRKWNGEIPTPRKKSHILLTKLPPWTGLHNCGELLYLVLVLSAATPIIVLTVFSSSLTQTIRSSSCLPNGEFQLPGSGSIWDSTYFFAVSIGFGQTKRLSYTHVKIIDIIWDVGVGRGSQVVLAYICYRVFSQALLYVMETQPVSYQTYGTVAFETGKSRALYQFLCALNILGDRNGRTRGNAPFKPSWRGCRVFTLMLFSTLYVVSLPTLFAAMTGYAAVATPAIQVPKASEWGYPAGWCAAGDGSCTTTQCGGLGSGVSTVFAGDSPWDNPLNTVGLGLQAGWGIVYDANRTSTLFNDQPWIVLQAWVDHDVFVKYHETYKDQYQAASSDPRCQNITDLMDCPPLARNTSIGLDHPQLHMGAPMLNIQTWGWNETADLPNVWVCSNQFIHTQDFNPNNVTGICTAGSNYQWGFSFLLLFIVCVFQFVFAIMIYALWIESERYITAKEADMEDDKRPGQMFEAARHPTVLSSALALAEHTEQDFGSQIRDWTSPELDTFIYRGSRGMRLRSRDKP